MKITTINPTTGAPLRSYPLFSRARVEAALARSHAAFGPWAALDFPARSRHMTALSGLLQSRSEALSRLATAEMGKPIAEARAEVAKCRTVCAYYARHARRFLAPERPAGAPRGARVVYEPMGPVLAVMPWNFPFWQVIRAAVPALMAGNTVLLKHAANVTGCALALERLFRAAGFPRGVFQALVIPVGRTQELVADPRISGVTLTGSTEAGRIVAAAAGAALKKGVYELGGSDPYLILRDADLGRAAAVCARARLGNSGQSCIAGKRFIVVRAVQARFERAFAAEVAAWKVGPPLDPSNRIGPLARRDLRDKLHRQVQASVRRGAKVILGGRVPPGPGNFYPPTILAGVRPGMPAYGEELFGPVASVIGVRDEAEAIAVANGTPYGLGAAVFTRNRRTAARVAAQLTAGAVFANDFVRSDTTLPFGGTKQSGYGRELGPHGIREFTHVKSLCLG
jgi:succinate-semialdehyde dehydrogenase / glutarate-semialdehyde dehydrogenase